ncbi:MAG: amidohydrolase [Rhizobiales bacterium]|nr:amidohydrolase [Hyphomicrobiales bacterium]
MSGITVFAARNILTMTRHKPEATHVAVRGGHILAVGSLEEVSGWGPYEVDTSLSDKVLMPGFVEGHCHLQEGGIWRYTYTGYHARIDPDGKHWDGIGTIEGVIARMREQEAKLGADEPLIAWGFDPIFLGDRRPDRHDLDQVSARRPIIMIHSNFHVLTVNTAALKLADYSDDLDIEGIVRDEDGAPNGELQEMAAMFPVMRRANVDFRDLARHRPELLAFGKACKQAGVTTATDLFNSLPQEDLETLLNVTAEADFPARIVPALNSLSAPPDDIVARALALRTLSTDKLRLGQVKLMTDGSIQAFTGRLLPPGYYNGAPNGIWNIAPEQLDVLVEKLVAAGIHMHIHTNGDEATEVTLNAIERALRSHNQPDHRHVLQHVQMANPAQFRRMKALGLCANLFANHLFFFGDQHAAITMGPDRARRMNACRTALDTGVPLAIHSDAPVTPLGPLTTAWAAVNRLTGSGEVLGAAECITVAEALHAITLGAAYTLHLDDEIGSIEVGKKADFAVLEEDPTKVDPKALKDVPVWGTVLGGVVHPVG